MIAPSRKQTDSHWCISDLSGFKYPADEMVWGVDIQEGLLIHYSEQSEYNPQHDLRPRIDDQRVYPVRGRQTDVFGTGGSANDL